MTRGSIRDIEKYKQAKLLDHSGWSAVLRSGITPSDIDMVVESRSEFLFVELKDRPLEWSEIPKGERLMLMRLALQWKQIPILSIHEQIPTHLAINTFTDIRTFSPLIKTQYGDEQQFWTREFNGAELWRSFVTKFTNGGLSFLEIRQRVLEKCIEVDQ